MSGFDKFQRYLIILLIAVGFFYGGYYFGKRGFEIQVRKDPPSIEVLNKYPKDQTVDFALFWEVWTTIEDEYLLRPIDPQKMLYGAIDGMVKSLDDPYTSFLEPTLNEKVQQDLDGKYQGIGAELGMDDNNILIVVAPIDGSPAKDAGIKPGDQILGIDGESTYGLSVSGAVNLIRGSSGTSVTLTIRSGDQEPRDIALTRGIIKISSVKWEDKGDGNAYIRISRFGTDTNDEWDKAVKEIMSQMDQLDAVVIDVRGNPGGYLLSAVHIAGEFYKGVVVYEEDATGNQQPLKSTRAGSFKDVPQVVVLIDQGSASASEILAAALKSEVNATLVGAKSFGKGTIQNAMDFEGDKSGLHLTIAKWLTPKKEWVHNTKDREGGITPDFIVEFTKEDIEKANDAQLNKALEIANEI